MSPDWRDEEKAMPQMESVSRRYSMPMGALLGLARCPDSKRSETPN